MFERSLPIPLTSIAVRGSGGKIGPGHLPAMPCLLTLLALAVPRLVIVLLWIFSGWFTGMFASWIWPLLGFLFLPTTLLWYSAVQHWWGGTWSFGPILGLVIAVLIDASPSSGRRRRRD